MFSRSSFRFHDGAGNIKVPTCYDWSYAISSHQIITMKAHDGKTRHPRIIAIEGDYREAVFKRRGSNERVHIANEIPARA
jgi:hypothetical protein